MFLMQKSFDTSISVLERYAKYLGNFHCPTFWNKKENLKSFLNVWHGQNLDKMFGLFYAVPSYTFCFNPYQPLNLVLRNKEEFQQCVTQLNYL